MKPRRIYWRKKGKSLIIEGRLSNGKPLLIWTLPNADKFVCDILANASFLPREKMDQIKAKYLRLDYKKDLAQKCS